MKALSDDTIFAHECLRFASEGGGGGEPGGILHNRVQSDEILLNQMESGGIGSNNS